MLRIAVADPANLELLDATPTQGQALDMAYEYFGNQLVVAEGASGIGSYNVQGSGPPVHLGTTNLGGTIVSLSGSAGDYVAGSSEGTLYLVTLGADDLPVVESQLALSGQVVDVLESSRRAYCALGGANAVAVVGVLDRSAPSLVAVYNLPGAARSLARTGDLLLVGVEGTGLVVFQIRDTGIVVKSGNNTANPVSPVSSGGDVVASAVIVPSQEANLAFVAGGNVAKVYVKVGDRITAGHILVELDNTLLQLEVDRVERTLRELTSPAAIAAAEQAVANAQDVYDDAKKKVDSLKYRNTDNVTIDYLQDQVTLAQDALDRARDAYNQTAGLSDLDPARAKARTNLYNAQKAYNTAVGNLNWYTALPSENDIATVTADFDAASAALQEAQWYLAELKGESIPADATGLKLAQLQQAKSDLKASQVSARSIPSHCADLWRGGGDQRGRTARSRLDLRPLLDPGRHLHRAAHGDGESDRVRRLHPGAAGHYEKGRKNGEEPFPKDHLLAFESAFSRSI